MGSESVLPSSTRRACGRRLTQVLASVALTLPNIGFASEPPRFFVTPLSIDFGPVAVGSTSSTVAVTIRNASFRPMHSFAGGAPSDPQFAATQNCAGGVAPGASCQYFFTFTPASAGPHSAISSSSTHFGPFTIELRGTGVGPRLHVTPLSLDFGYVPIGTTSATQTVTIRNTGLATLTNFAGGAPANPRFGVTQNCAAGVPPGGSCQYFFTFSPNAAGTLTTSSSSSTNAGPIVIALRGTGGPPPSGPVASYSPLILDFGRVGLGTTSATQIVTIRNQGNATLGSFAGGAPFDPQFNVTQNCAAGVAPGASCQYNFSFSPNALGPAQTTSNSSSNGGTIVIELRGESVGAERVFSPLSLDFGPVPIGTTSPVQSVTIRNVGLATLGGFAGGTPFNPQFGATQTCAGGVAPGASCQYNFTFTPSTLGASQTTSNSSTDAGPIVISLRGFGVPAGLIFFDGFEP